MTSAAPKEVRGWLASAVALLTPRRIHAQAAVLALCLWGVCAVDFATPGVLDRAGDVKFQDFLPLYVSAHLIAQNRASELYDEKSYGNEMQSLVRLPARVRLLNLYGPQMGLFFVPVARFSFQTAAWIWVALCFPMFFACIFLVWKHCPALRSRTGIVALCALAFPPLFHCFVRGQISVLPLACFTAAYLAFRAQHEWLAGIALGLLIFKPQFLVAVPLVLLLARSWSCFVALTLSAAAQLAFTSVYFGSAIMRSYFEMLLNTPRWITTAELSLAPIQMHSLRSFWSLLIPSPNVALALYLITSCITIAIATAVWKSSRALAVRFSALTLAAVLVNPHLFVYDLLTLAPAFLLLTDWTVSSRESSWMRLLLYLAFITPLLGPLSQYSHIQLSVLVFAALLWTISKTDSCTLTSVHCLPTKPPVTL